MDQLIVILLVLVFTGADLLLRWLKQRTGGSAPPVPRRREDDEEESADVPDWLEDLRRHQQEQWRREEAEAARPTPSEPPRGEPARPAPMRGEPVRAEPPAPQPPVAEVPFPVEGPRPRLAPTPAQAALAARMEQRAPGAGRRPRYGGASQIRTWLRSPQDIRKGIILMEILGPAKGG